MNRVGPTGRTPLPLPLDPAAAARPTRFDRAVPIPDVVLGRLQSACDTQVGAAERVEAGRDWWPLAVRWAADHTVPALPAAVSRPSNVAEVSAVLAICNDARIPVTPFAGLSGVCGGAVPLQGGLSLDLTGLSGIVGTDDRSLTVDVRAGTFGDVFEDDLRRDHALTAGHWPQSMALSTIGGWAACRSAGQYSTRYGKIEDIVAGLEVVLADGRIIQTGSGAPRAATGPDLTQLFVGSEGTLGVITALRLRAHPLPPAERRAAYAFGSFAGGLDACRRILRRGATPAVLRLYDPAESARSFDVADRAVLIVVDEGDPALIDAVMDVVAQEAAEATSLDRDLAGLVVDTVEIAGSWRALPTIYEAAVAGVNALPATVAISAHESHAYTDGGCLYFTFAGQPEAGVEAAEVYYRQAFDAITYATLTSGGAISHHHGIGMNRGRYLREQLGDGFSVLTALKAALDPRGILNPGKLGLDSPFGAWEIP